MRMDRIKKFGVLAVCAAMAVSAVCVGFSAWNTTVGLNGSVAAAGKWDVAVTAAGMEVSTGAAVSERVASRELVRTGVKDDTLIAATISAGAWVDDESLVGTQSGEAMSKYTYYYAVDTARYDLSDLSALTKEDVAAIAADETTVTISDHLNMYYRYVNGDPSVGTAAGSSASAGKVVDGLLRDTLQLVAAMHPDTWQNYMLVYLSSTGGRFSYSLAAMKETVETVPAAGGLAVISDSGDTAAFADVTFSLPGAWANYSVTITNNGTGNANLKNWAFDAAALDEAVYTVEMPAFGEDEILAPGESCTFNFVVRVNDLDEFSAAAAPFAVTLRYVQDTVEDAPAAGHTHG